MEDKLENLLSSCSEIDFGDVNISDKEKAFCDELNNEIINLCKSLPESTQTDALLFFMRYTKTSFRELNFFKMYYIPTWSILYWLIQSGPRDKGLKQKDIKNAMTAHSMAMFLHALDDHLNDNELPVTHLALLLRSQSWMIMNHAFNRLADGVEDGPEIVQGFIDDYYSCISDTKEIESLDGYCDLFRKQMATGLIAPVLMAKRMTKNERFSSDIQTAYGSFGIAWRLLDDITDIEMDMMNSVHSAVYICLSENIKDWWNKYTGDKNSADARVILNFILENHIIVRLKQRICRELEAAASIADDHHIKGLADEFRCLLGPLKKRQDHL